MNAQSLPNPCAAPAQSSSQCGDEVHTHLFVTSAGSRRSLNASSSPASLPSNISVSPGYAAAVTIATSMSLSIRLIMWSIMWLSWLKWWPSGYSVPERIEGRIRGSSVQGRRKFDKIGWGGEGRE